MCKRHPWTRDEIALLRKHASTISSDQIAKLVLHDAAGIRVKASKLGISLRKSGANHYRTKYSDDEVERVRSLSDSGKSVQAIHEETNIPRTNLYDWLSYRTRV